MIVCSCAAISDTDIEQALVEILSQPGAPLPTPGVVYRHLEKKMVCCGCAPLAVSTIYQKIDELAEQGVVCPYACACAQGRLLKCASETPALQLIQRAPDPAPTAETPIAAATAVWWRPNKTAPEGLHRGLGLRRWLAAALREEFPPLRRDLYGDAAPVQPLADHIAAVHGIFPHRQTRA